LLGWNIERGTLARAPLAGGAPREILEDVEWADWSEDGANLAVVRFKGGYRSLEFPVGRVLYSTAGWISHPRISRDGKWVAFLDHPAWPDDRGSLVLVDVAENKKVLTSGWSTIQGLAWTPRGDEIWFTASNGSINRKLHAVTLSGKQREIVQIPAGLLLYDISPLGRVLLSREDARFAIVGRSAGQPGERDLSWMDWSLDPDLSSDGTKLLFTEESEGTGTGDVVCLRNMDGSSPIRLGEGFTMALSPDAKWALALVYSSPQQLVLFPTGPGARKPLPNPIIEFYSPESTGFFQDGKKVFFVGNERGHLSRAYAQDIETGKITPLSAEGLSFPHTKHLVSSNAESILVNGKDGKLAVYSLQTGAVRPIEGAKSGDSPIQWSADGHSLLVWNSLEFPVRIYRLEFANSKRQMLRDLPAPDPAGLELTGEVVVTPDLKSYAFSFGRTLSELYTVDGLK
jgi:eukaryotic-like serine/threonine-protein kinase